MSRFDNGMAMACSAEVGEMGEDVILKGFCKQGIVDVVEQTVERKAGGVNREVGSVDIYFSKDAVKYEDVKRGDTLKVRELEVKVERVFDLGGAGIRVECGAMNRWGGRVPGV